LYGAEHDQDLIYELAKVSYDKEAAQQLALRARFRAALLPDFATPLGFWTKVVEQLRNGATEGGVLPLIEQAVELWPGNREFARCLAAEREWEERGRPQLATDATSKTSATSKKATPWPLDGAERMARVVDNVSRQRPDLLPRRGRRR
jgi:hypothetical protein